MPGNKPSNKSGARPAPAGPRSTFRKPAGKAGASARGQARGQVGGQAGARAGAKPQYQRHGIIEVASDVVREDAFERVERIGEASIGDAPESGHRGWDIADQHEEHADTSDDFLGDDHIADEDASDEANDDQGDDEGDEIEARQRVRLQRVLADAGVAARRHAEGLIEQGRVTVNGQAVLELPCFVDPHFDRIHVDGRPIPKPARHVYVMFNKPERVLVTDADEPGMDRRTLRDFVEHPGAPRLFAIGRLDFQTTGVVLMTNDGELSNRVSHPRANLAKTYHVVVKGAPTPQNMKVFTRAAAQGDRDIAKTDPRAAMKMRSRPRTPLEVRVVTSDAAKSLLEVTTRDERNLDLRGACLAAGLPVKKITRVSYGPIRLTALPLGNWRELTRPEINALKKAARLARDGRASPPPSNPGVDFSSIPTEKFGEPDADQGAVKSAKPGLAPSPSKPRPMKPGMAKTGKSSSGPHKSGPSKPGLHKSAPTKATKPVARPGPASSPSRPSPSRPAPRDPESRPANFRPRVIS